MPSELTALLGNIIAQLPLVAVVSYLWFQDRKDKLAQIKRLVAENKEKMEIMEKITGSIEKLSLSLELIKDRLR